MDNYSEDINIKLRGIEPEDINLMFSLDNNTSDWIDGSMIAPVTRHQLTDYVMSYDSDPFAARQLRLVAVRPEDDSPVGLADIMEINPANRTAKIGIAVIPELRNSGYGTGIIKSCTKYCRDILGLEAVIAEISSENVASIKCFNKAGYTECGRVKDWIRTGVGRADMVILEFQG